MEYIQRTKFGPSEGGSFVLTIESSVPPQLTEPPGLPESEPEPFERSVCLALAEAASAARRIVDQLSVTRSSETVIAGVPYGVSSNFCEALAGLLDDTGVSRSLEMSFRWAAARPAGEAPRRVVFEHDAAPFLSEMGRTLREQSEIRDFELVGPVHKLASDAPDQGGEIVVVSTIAPLVGRKVRVALAGSAYQHAARAHADGLWISCEGELVRQGSATLLLDPRNLVAFAPDAMRTFTS